MNLDHLMQQDTADDAVVEYAKCSDVVLGQYIVNVELNRLIERRDRPSRPLIPYAGWYWRFVDFFDSRAATIADMGSAGVAMCQNNKWDYPERDLTEVELNTFRGLVWQARIESGKGGSLTDIHDRTDAALKSAGYFIRGLTV